jgi:biopolymer transport protein ExbD
MARQSIQREDEEGSEVNLTPMLDVVFIMLIFFIVTASFIKEPGVLIRRPEAATAELKQRANILIALTQNGEVWIQKRKVDIRSVRPVVERMLAENPLGSVVIQADERSKHGLFVKVMDQTRQAGARTIAIAARETP